MNVVQASLLILILRMILTHLLYPNQVSIKSTTKMSKTIITISLLILISQARLQRNQVIHCLIQLKE